MRFTEPHAIHIAPGLSVLVRGWVHGNCVLALPVAPRFGTLPTLIDTGYHTGVDALLGWVSATLGAPAAGLGDILLTHVHSDHARPAPLPGPGEGGHPRPRRAICRPGRRPRSR